MGGSAGTLRTAGAEYKYWTAEEKLENEKCEKIQKDAAKYVTSYLYYNVPCVVKKVNKDPTSPIWIELAPEVVKDRKVDTVVLKSVPTGVSVDKDGNMKAFFEKTRVEYEFSLGDVKAALGYAILDKTDIHTRYCPPPKQIRLDAFDSTSMSLSWEYPQVPGLTHQVEVQLMLMSSDPRKDKATLEEGMWQTLYTKNWESKDFFSYKFEKLLPGQRFVFRWRYHNFLGWSPYANISDVCQTLPDRPTTPKVPYCAATFADSAQLYWSAPTRDNGKPVFEYRLRGKTSGGCFTEYYRGKMKSTLLVNLEPETWYSFEVSAVNSVGESEYSEGVSVQTKALFNIVEYGAKKNRRMSTEEDQARRVALACRDAWIERWDPKTEQYFYFNRITGTRQLQVPEILALKAESVEVDEEEEARKQADIKFRTKRFRLVKGMHKNAHGAQQFTTSRRPSHTEEDDDDDERSRPPHQQTYPITVRRNMLLYDGFVRLGTVPVDAMYKRLKVEFEGEPGIDSGGLGKEAFLLISREAMQYCGGHHRGWMRQLEDTFDEKKRKIAGGLFFCEISENDKKPKENPGDGQSNDASHMSMTDARKKAAELLHEAETGESKDGDTGKQQGKKKKGEGASKYRGRRKRAQSDDEKYDLPEDAMHEIAAGSGKSTVETQIESTSSSTGNVKGPDATQPGIGMPSAGITAATAVELEKHPQFCGPRFAYFMGRFIGKALYDRQLIDMNLSPLLYRHMLGGKAYELPLSSYEEKPSANDGELSGGETDCRGSVNQSSDDQNDSAMPETKDEGAKKEPTPSKAFLNELRVIDETMYNSLNWMLSNDITDIIYETFTVEALGQQINLCPDGASRDVDNENKWEYAKLLVQYKAKYAISDMLHPFLQGFHELVPLQCLQDAHISITELDLMLNGRPILDVEEIRAYCIYQGAHAGSEEDLLDAGIVPFGEKHVTVTWLWQVMRDFKEEERRSLLKFFTGSAKVPLDGFDPPLNITEGCDMLRDSLPKAHTCFNQIVLPEYTSYEKMKEKIRFAIVNTEGFNLA
jgi:hypothetical protein